MTDIIYENIHKHTMYSNIMTPDSIITIEDIAKRSVELGHKTISTVEHGYAGNVFEYYDVAEKYNLKMIFGVEFYYVHDRFAKDRTNAHLLILAKNNRGKKQLTKLISEAGLTGYYFKPRIDKELLFSLNPDDVLVTSTCIASPYRLYDDECFITDCYEYFGNNFYLEIHDNTHHLQVEYNKKLLRLHEELNIPLIHACDTHYIHEEDAIHRDDLLKGKGINYPDEEGFVMDYPDTGTIFKRYEKQGVFNRDQVIQSLKNTQIVYDFEDIRMDKEIKMPTLYPELSHEEKIKKLKNIITNEWKDDKKELNEDTIKDHIKAIQFETNIVEETKMEDYFLLNYEVIKKAKEKGGILTRTGRGSAPSFYINKLLGFTEIDRLEAPITLYPTRFMSKSRILETKSLPDIDFNTADPTPFIDATREILGDDQCYYMTAYGTMQESEAFRNLCRARKVDYDLTNKIAKDLDGYKSNEEWKDFIKESRKFIGVIDSVSPHPCFVGDTLIMTSTGMKEIRDIKEGDIVLTHKNKFRRVLKTMKSERTDIYDVKIMGSPTTKVTSNHPYYTRKMNKDGYGVKTFSKPDWTNVKELQKGHYVGIAINKNEEIPKINNLPTHNNSFWWLIGRYIGDGWWKNLRPSHKQQGEYNTIICCNHNETKEIIEHADKLSDYFNYYITNERTVKRFNFLSKTLWEFVQQFGKGAKNKKLTDTILDLPRDLLQSFVDGYISADGSTSMNKVQITTVSRQLAYGIQNCIHKAYRRPSKLTIIKRKDSVLDERILRGNTQYIVRFTLNKVKKEQAFYEDGYIWTPFRAKTLTGEKETTFNLEVEDDNSYTANNIIVHNCATLIMNENISEEVGLIRTGDGKDKPYVYCALIDSDTSDAWKYLKNDYLSVTVWKIISDVYKSLNKPIDNIRELTQKTENEDDVWGLYEKGLTTTLNQTGTLSGKPQVIRYKPKSIRELSGWVSAIRPQFKSMKDIFLDRKGFSYGIPEFDELLKESDNFILFQENIMATLVFAGFPEDETYGLLKKIAKKKKGFIEKIEDKFIKGFTQKTGNEDQAKKVWTIIQDSVGYGFNSSHAYAVALDSLYGAYLKARFPMDYFAIVLNIYEDDTEKTAQLHEELREFNIKVLPIQFGKSKAEYTPQRDENSIYKGIKSIKFLNKRIATELYQLAQENNYETFTELLIDIVEKTSVDSRQLDILIKLNFFEQFGDIERLLAIYNNFANGKSKYKKTYVAKTKEKRIPELIEWEKNTSDIILFPANQIIQFEKEHLGYATYTEDVPMSHCVVTDINTKYTPVITFYQLRTGKEVRAKIKKNTFFSNQGELCSIGDYVEIVKTFMDGKWIKKDNPKEGEFPLYQDHSQKELFVSQLRHIQ